MSNGSLNSQLREALERRRAAKFPGVKDLKPLRLLDKVFGDGLQLIAFQPMNAGLNYYVIRGDSSWRTSDAGGECSRIWDHIEEIIKALEDQFGHTWHQGDRPATSRDNERPFYPTKDDCRCNWFFLKWPVECKPPCSGTTGELIKDPASDSNCGSVPSDPPALSQPT